MAIYYVPYSGNKPASIHVNGHRLLILAEEEAVFENELPRLGADEVKSVDGGESQREEDSVLKELAESIDAGLVIAPVNIEMEEVIKNLEEELPWIQ